LQCYDYRKVKRIHWIRMVSTMSKHLVSTLLLHLSQPSLLICHCKNTSMSRNKVLRKSLFDKKRQKRRRYEGNIPWYSRQRLLSGPVHLHTW
jgi:hypothetical protein